MVFKTVFEGLEVLVVNGLSAKLDLLCVGKSLLHVTIRVAGTNSFTQKCLLDFLERGSESSEKLVLNFLCLIRGRQTFRKRAVIIPGSKMLFVVFRDHVGKNIFRWFSTHL